VAYVESANTLVVREGSFRMTASLLINGSVEASYAGSNDANIVWEPLEGEGSRRTQSRRPYRRSARPSLRIWQSLSICSMVGCFLHCAKMREPIIAAFCLSKSPVGTKSSYQMSADELCQFVARAIRRRHQGRTAADRRRRGSREFYVQKRILEIRDIESYRNRSGRGKSITMNRTSFAPETIASKAQRRRTIRDENPAKSTNATDMLPLITVWRQVGTLPGRLLAHGPLALLLAPPS